MIHRTFASYAFGCRVNQAEKEQLDTHLISRGYTYSEENPDLYIINTCSVTHKAEREARQLINQVHARYPQTEIVVTGCAATNWIKTNKKVPHVCHVVDNMQKEYLAEIIDTRRTGSLFKKDAILPRTDKYISSHRVLMKIQDGCHRYCSFCIVPYLRGMPRSIPIAELVARVQALPSDIQEVICAAINTQAYGYGTEETFVNLLAVLLQNSTVPRISFGSIHPWSFDEAFFTLYANHTESKQFVHFFHIPLQSGCNKILRLMKRDYTREEIMDKIHRLHSLNSWALIGTDVIVGYLDETDKDFEDTYTFLERTPIHKFHVFRYSEREHTAASYMGKRMQEPTPQEKTQRSRALRELGEKKYGAFLQSMVGKTGQVLFLTRTKQELWQGLFENQVPVYVASEQDLTGSLMPVQILRYQNSSLFGRMN